MERINELMDTLAQYNRMLDETTTIIDGLKDEIKTYMVDNNIDTINGTSHKATYKAVTSSRIDTRALKSELPDIANRYTVSSSTMRFSFS